MASNIITLFAVLLPLKMCNGRYVVPGRPPIDLKNATDDHPEVEFRDHALRVGNIIADLLRSELRLMLNINSTIANGKRHNHHHSEEKSHDHHHDTDLGEQAHTTESKSKESFKSEEIHTTDESHVHILHHNSDPKPAEKHAHSQKEKNGHSHGLKDKNKEDKSVPKPVNNCICPDLKKFGAQPNTLLLEQKFYGALLSNVPLQSDSDSPIIVQRFILNPSNVSQAQVGLHQSHDTNLHQVQTHQVSLKPSATTNTTSKASNDKHPNDRILENKKHNINPHSHHIVPEPTTSSESTLAQPKQTSYNPLADLKEGAKDLNEENDSQDLLGEPTIQPDGGDVLNEDNPEIENQIESPGFYLEETTVTEKPPEEVKEEDIHVHVTNADED